MKKNREKNSYVKAAKTMKKERIAKQKKSSVFASEHKGWLGRFIGKTAGILCCGIGLLTLAVMSIRSHHYGTDWTFTHYFYLFVLVAGVILCLHTVRAENQMIRFRYYRSIMEGKEYMLLSEIEKITGKKISFLQKDLSKMSRDKLFLQANMNREGTCLFLTEDAFKRYQRGQLIFTADSDGYGEAAQQEEQGFGTNRESKAEQSGGTKAGTKAEQGGGTKAGTKTEQSGGTSAESNSASWESSLHSLNHMLTQIHNQDIITPVSGICIRGQQIIYFKDTTIKNEVAHFLNYYLPVTQKVLTTYLELEKEGLEDQAPDLQIIMNTIQHSFDSFVEKLIEGKRVDVEEDIASVEMMLSHLS